MLACHRFGALHRSWADGMSSARLCVVELVPVVVLQVVTFEFKSWPLGDLETAVRLPCLNLFDRHGFGRIAI